MADSSIIKRVRISKIIEETTNAKTFILEPLDDWKPVYKTGQFITLVFYTKHGEKRRSFSISSSHELNEPLSITIKKLDNGEFSRPLVQQAKTGDIFHTSGISGFFTLPENLSQTKHVCFLAAGSGITPCLPLIKSLLTTTSAKITLIYSNKNEKETVFYEQLKSLREKYHERFMIRFLFSDHNDIYYKRLSKWLLDQLLDMFVPDPMHTLFYLCGPYDYMQTAEITLLIRTPKKNIIKENFSSFPRLILPEPPDAEKHKVTIHLNGKTHVLDVQYPKSIHKVAKEKKIDLPYSCEAGRCGSCVAACTKGKIWMAYNEILTDKEVQKGRVLVCQSYPIGGDAEITFDEI
jgi:ring-1,2-phenylacetyl-CoA epoxidase subunit PaaE